VRVRFLARSGQRASGISPTGSLYFKLEDKPEAGKKGRQLIKGNTIEHLPALSAQGG
jgi:hypothetical protein